MSHESLLAEFRSQRDVLDAERARLEAELRAVLDGSGVQVHVISSRLKAEDSLRRKLARPDKTYAALWDVTDLVGLRVSTYFEDGIDEVATAVRNRWKLDVARSVDRRAPVDAEKFGYRSLHCVCELDQPTALPGAFRFEVQVRTVLQHAWAEIEHDLGYKSAFGLPEPMRRRFSRVASLLEIADEEFVALRRELTQYQSTVRRELSAATSLPLDAVSLHELTLTPAVAALDAQVAHALNRPTSDERFFPDYLLRLLTLTGLDSTAMVTQALEREAGRAARLVQPYFSFAERMWKLLPAHVEVQRGYGLFFLAHAHALSAASPVEVLTAAYRALDYPDDAQAATQTAHELVLALR